MTPFVMTKEDCVFCNGTGVLTPYPYQKDVKCNHRCDKDRLMASAADLLRAKLKAEREHARYMRALATGRKT